MIQNRFHFHYVKYNLDFFSEMCLVTRRFDSIRTGASLFNAVKPRSLFPSRVRLHDSAVAVCVIIQSD